MTKIKLKLIPHSKMFIFFEKCTKAAISGSSHGYSKANNEYIKSCDSKEQAKHLIYLDANNLYGYAVSKFLPTGDFKWIDPKQLDLNECTSNSSKRFVLDVDLVYPKQLWELHIVYFLVPDKIEIKEEKLSKYQILIADFYNIPILNVIKLVPNFFDKEKYVLHYENLHLYVRLGLRLKQRINRLSEFK